MTGPEEPPLPSAPDDATASRPSLLQRLGPAGILGFLWALAPAGAGFLLLAKIGPVSEWLTARGDAGVLIFVGAFAVTAGLGLLPTYAQAVLAGWVFGLGIGLPAALAGFTLAAIIGFIVTRIVARNRVRNVIDEHPRGRAIRNALLEEGAGRTLGIVTLVRVPPNSPFALTNLLLASCGVAALPYVVGTLVGMAPRTAAAVFFAHSAQATGARDIQTFVKDGPGLMVFLVGLGLLVIVLAVIGSIANRAVDRLVARPEAAVTDADASA